MKISRSISRLKEYLLDLICSRRSQFYHDKMRLLHEYEDSANRYHLWYYQTEVHKSVQFLGHRCMKSVSDLWNYQEILWILRSSLVIEFGTFMGGSALYYASLLGQIHANYHVLTVDLSHDKVPEAIRAHAHIEFMTCSSTAPQVAERINILRKEFTGPVFFILDSDHSKAHVLQELQLLRGVTRPGDYVIVEDSNINGHPVFPEAGPGPYEALAEYTAAYPNDYEHDVIREKKFGFTFAPNGFLIRR